MRRFLLVSIAFVLIPHGIGTLLAQDSTPPAPAPAVADSAPTAAPAATDSAPTAAPTATDSAAAAMADSTPTAAPAKAAVAAPPPEEFQRRLAEVLLRGITLTAEQKTKLDGLMASHKADRSVFGTAAADSATMAARVALIRRHMAENRAVLTAEQQAIYDRNVAQLRQILTPPRGS